MADPTRDPWLVSLDNEFLDSEMTFAPIAAWESAGSNAIINPLTVIEIDITNIEPIVSFNYVTLQIDTTSFVSAIPNDEMDDSAVFTALIDFVRDRQLNETGHVRILIPPGVYNFSDQIVMHSNISLKGAGSNLTELRFLIREDSTGTTMSEADCKKDAIFVNGSDDQRNYNVGIEDLKIVRIKEGLSAREVKAMVGDYDYVDDIQAYWGNNIAIRRATNCWVTGVESENTFRNHVTLEFAEHITVSGVYFHHANNYGPNGYGYGVGIWDSGNNLVENSIFVHLRHGVTIVDGSWFNVIGYNYFRDQHSYAELPISTIVLPFPNEIEQKWSDIAIHEVPPRKNRNKA